MHNHALRALALTTIVVCTPGFKLAAEITRPAPALIPHVFVEIPQFLPDATTWVDYRLYHDHPTAHEFGMDFEIGSAISLVASPRVAFRFIPRLLYQARKYRKTDNPFDFSPRHITADLRATGAFRFDAATLYSGWRHDCTHIVDTQGGRKPIHDGLLVGVEGPIPPLPLGNLTTVTGDVLLEGEYNVPSLFWDEAAFIDRGRVTTGADLRVATGDLGAVFINGYASYINRDPHRTITEGLETHNLDWGVAGGYRFRGITGDLALYYRVEGFTDSWTSRDVRPVVVQSIGAMIRM